MANKDFEDEIARLEKEQEKERKENEAIKHSPSAKSIPEPNTSAGTLFPSLLKNSIREKAKLVEKIKTEESKNKPEKEDEEEELLIPDFDSRQSLQTAEQALQVKQFTEMYNELLQTCGYCQKCDNCKKYAYCEYKSRLSGSSLVDIELRVDFFEKARIMAMARERACRDLWEEKLISSSDIEKEERRAADNSYVILTPENKKKISKAAKDIAEGKKPAKRMSSNKRLEETVSKLGINFGDLMKTIGTLKKPDNPS